MDAKPCPNCGKLNLPKKSWEMSSPRGRRRMRVVLYKCENCGKTYRKAEPVA